MFYGKKQESNEFTGVWPKTFAWHLSPFPRKHSTVLSTINSREENQGDKVGEIGGS